MSTASDVYRKAVTETQSMRQEYFNFQLPRILRVRHTELSPMLCLMKFQALKECADEIDLGTQYHLTRYAYLYETIVLSDGTTLAPPASDEGLNLFATLSNPLIFHAHLGAHGLKATVEAVDNRHDFKVYMQNYAYAHGGQAHRGPKREGPWDEGYVSVKTNLTLTIRSSN